MPSEPSTQYPTVESNNIATSTPEASNNVYPIAASPLDATNTAESLLFLHNFVSLENNASTKSPSYH